MKLIKIEPLNIDGLTEQENDAVTVRLESLLHSWLGTPFLAGKNVRGRGVDCVHFVASIYDALLGTEYRHENLPQDASFHNKSKAEAGLRKFCRMYPSTTVKGDVAQPGDTIICGPAGENGGPGHGMIVGKHQLWHVDSKSVCWAGLGVMQQGAYAFKQIRRINNRKAMLHG
jgi:cell wall-associated NlpC family hydrolase